MPVQSKQKEIQWFFDLIAIEDMGRLSEDERAEVASVINRHTRYRDISGAKDHETAIDSKFIKHLKNAIAPERLAGFQKKIADFWGFTSLMLARTQNLAQKRWIKNPGIYPSLNRESIEIPLELTVKGFQFYRRESGGVNEYRIVQDRQTEPKIAVSSHTVASMAEGLFLYSFIQLLDGIPITAFRECPGCENWFVNLTKRKRVYCGNRCAAKMGKRKERAESIRRIGMGDHAEIEKREIELKKGRERSRKSYESKVRVRHPRAKINRRGQ